MKNAGIAQCISPMMAATVVVGIATTQTATSMHPKRLFTRDALGRFRWIRSARTLRCSASPARPRLATSDAQVLVAHEPRQPPA